MQILSLYFVAIALHLVAALAAGFAAHRLGRSAHHDHATVCVAIIITCMLFVMTKLLWLAQGRYLTISPELDALSTLYNLAVAGTCFLATWTFRRRR